MKAKILIVLIGIIIITACNKDKYTDAPQISLKSVNTTVLYPNNVLTFDITVTDKQGDVQDTIWVQKITANCSLSDFTQSYPVPYFNPTKNFKGVFELSYAYGIGTNYPPIKEPSCFRQNDTCVFKFWMKDLANHQSDTITTPTIILIHR